MSDETTATWQDLSSEHQDVVRKITDAMVEGLNEYAEMMERGDLEMMPGPKALRWVAGAINIAMIQQESQHDQ